MGDGLRLDMELPTPGIVTIRLSGRAAKLDLTCTSIPDDSIGDLARAATGLLAGEPEQVVVWNDNPQQYEFVFTSTCGRTRLEVRAFPGRVRSRLRPETPVTAVEADTVEFARAIWRGLRRLQGALSEEEFLGRWHHPFPTATVERLGEQLQGRLGWGV